MENEAPISGTVDVPAITEHLPPEPVPGTEEQKPTPPEGEDSPEETTEQQEAKKQSKFQRRLDRQKSARVAAETELRLTKERLAQLEAQPKASQEAPGPQRDQYETLEDYLKAVSKHEYKQLIDGTLKTEREAKIAKDWTDRETGFQAATKDYADAVTSYIEDEVGQLSDVGLRVILESDVGPQLLYHLAKNPDEAERIADLSPVRQVAELGKLESKMTPVTKKTSNAPAPIKPVSSGRSASPGFSDHDSQAEFEAKRKSQGARWAR